ncbi:PucR family transcriptional regulator [Evansella tamaricis]|uniref:PucR family transcriptional regulator ligand-binding domain-containing protein n=1 Tax=Evansella tamaricis TaxID=2069301 RepID=A0ABS6JFR7_9BACI|nr:PucR family transcriptional regulator [Evansella tamaricis]MBU9711305.1 PucR family transcriptional regulator ligand-binding domain-containing protein [Evansella tamaricis]
MLTIYEAMQLPALRGTKLIGGLQGKENPIKWVTTIEIIEDITRFQDGEFVVTTGFGLMDNPVYRLRLIELIRLKKLSGLALYTGFYIETIPENIIKEADKVHLPLIEIPNSINFSTITKAIVEQIGNKQMRLLQDSLKIHKEMTKLAVNNDGLEEVLEKLSPLTETSLCVFDDVGQLLALKNIHFQEMYVEESWIIIDGQKHDLTNLFQSGNDKSINLIQWGDIYCFLSPIKSDYFTYGFLLAIQKKQVWSEMDDIIMDHVSTLIGIELVKQYAIEETRVRLQGELVEEILMRDHLNKETAIKRGKKLGFDLTKSHAVLFFKFTPNGTTQEDRDWGNHLYYIVAKLLSSTNRQYILLPKVNELYSLIEVDLSEKIIEKDKMKQLADQILHRWCHHFKEKIMIGIGNAYQEINDVAASAKEAESAVKYAPLLLKEASVIHFEELGFYQMLIRMYDSGISLQAFYETYLGNLIQNKQHRTDLILTLETFLAHNCNIQQTAANLYIHRHTLKYRLSQIEKRTGFTLQSPDDRMNLHLAILAYKFVQLQKRQN